MTVNIELLDETLVDVERDPSTWHQVVWRCGSGGCFAARAALLAGSRWLHPDDTGDTKMAAHGERLVEAVWRRAQALLGLSSDQADELFAPENDLGDLRRIVAELKSSAAGGPAPQAPAAGHGADPLAASTPTDTGSGR